ncbi:hypothetical protein [Isachenkonia alkalipeptolytica]|uniref:Uncharacterized protein n=1 Tax=Isachenkonia alkalipeptolytica TaxID=2565777 RepID=A0AA43XJV9_9CLOT|nr:hypothetical protein [Isachenkonia alkalipeptolytica]NBG87230.1 hypothetical protein [Isachenkonia alkalipeptolytica]
MIEVLYDNPDLLLNISTYFKNYNRNISRRVFEEILSHLKDQEINQNINAYMMDAIVNQLNEREHIILQEFVIERWSRRGKHPLNPSYRMSIINYLLKRQYFNYEAIKDIIEGENEWIVRKSLIQNVNKDFIGEPSFTVLARKLLSSENVDEAITSAHEIIINKYSLSKPYNDINHIAQKVLKNGGIINRAASQPSMIHEKLLFICNGKSTRYTLLKKDWKKMLKDNHDSAESIIIRAYGYVQSDITAFVNILDTFNDLLMDRLFQHDPSIGKYVLGKPGSVLSSKSSRFGKKYPDFFKLCNEIHNKRLESDLSHPMVKATGNPTKRIKYAYINTVRKTMYAGYNELLNKW